MNESSSPKRQKLSEASCSYSVAVQTEATVVATKTRDHQNALVGTTVSYCLPEKPHKNTSSQCFMKKINEESFVDKTLLAWEFYDDGCDRILITAPPRFCKSTNISMLNEFFQIKHDENRQQIKNVTKDNGNYVPLEGNMSASWKAFKKMNIYTKCHCDPKNIIDCLDLCSCKEWFYEHCGQHPVISVDFKDLPGTSLDGVLIKLKRIIYKEFKKHPYLITRALKNGETGIWVWAKEELMREYDIEEFLTYFDYKICESKWEAMKSIEDKKDFIMEGLLFLAELLSIHFETQKTGKGVYLFIDEYDTPVTKGIFHDTPESEIKNICDFFTDFLGITLKGERSEHTLERIMVCAAVPIGALVSVGANNVEHRSFLSSTHQYYKFYGFLDDEVWNLLERHEFKTKNFADAKKEVEMWYNGYQVANVASPVNIYCPRSVIKYIDTETACCYWIDAVGSSHLESLFGYNVTYDVVNDILKDFNPVHCINIVSKLQIQHIINLRNLINNHFTYEHIEKNMVDLFFQYFAQCGYFLLTEHTGSYTGNIKCVNTEIKIKLIQAFVSARLTLQRTLFEPHKVQTFRESLKALRGNDKNLYLRFALSTSDLYNSKSLPANHFILQSDIYHFLVSDEINFPIVKAELPIDVGRAARLDVVAITKENIGYVIEVKRHKKDNADGALWQILSRNYVTVFDNLKHRPVEEKILIGLHLSDDIVCTISYLVYISKTDSVFKNRITVDSKQVEETC